MNVRHHIFGLLIALGVLAVPSAARADGINFMGTGNGMNVVVKSPGLGIIHVHAGELNWSRTSGDDLPLLFYSYCVDPNHYLTYSQDVTVRDSDELQVPGVTDAGGKAAWLINTYAGQIHQSGDDLQAAALQVAIWAAMYNANGSLTSGAFALQTTGAVATQAQTFLNNLFSGPNGYRTSNALWLDARVGQDQMTPVPEPGSLLLLGSGLAVAWRARRSRKAVK